MERPGRHAGTHVCAVQKTNISAGPKNGGRTDYLAGAFS